MKNIASSLGTTQFPSLIHKIYSNVNLAFLFFILKEYDIVTIKETYGLLFCNFIIGLFWINNEVNISLNMKLITPYAIWVVN